VKARDQPGAILKAGMKLKQYWPLCFLLAALSLATPLWAHHSWSTGYFVNATVTIKARITEFEYQNPHALLLLEVTDPKGATETWTGEWASAGKLSREGVTKGKLKPGDELTVIGNPGRPPDEHRIHVLGIRRSDGFKWGRQN